MLENKVIVKSDFTYWQIPSGFFNRIKNRITWNYDEESQYYFMSTFFKFNVLYLPLDSTEKEDRFANITVASLLVGRPVTKIGLRKVKILDKLLKF